MNLNAMSFQMLLFKTKFRLNELDFDSNLVQPVLVLNLDLNNGLYIYFPPPQVRQLKSHCYSLSPDEI